MQSAFIHPKNRALYERHDIETEAVDALENIFNNNLEFRAPDSKFVAIFERLKANEALWVDYEPGNEYWPIARLHISKSTQYKKEAEGCYYLLRSKLAGASKDFWIVGLQSYIKDTWYRCLRYVYRGVGTQETVATSFFHAVYLEKDHGYIVKEVSSIGSNSDYVTIKMR